MKRIQISLFHRRRTKTATIFHFGFWSYLLIVAIAVLVIGVIYPPFFTRLTDMLGQLSRAIHGSQKLTRDEDSLAGAIIGILAGLVGVAILMSIFGPKKKCPYCSKDIPQNAAVCPLCNARLNW